MNKFLKVTLSGLILTSINACANNLNTTTQKELKTLDKKVAVNNNTTPNYLDLDLFKGTALKPAFDKKLKVTGYNLSLANENIDIFLSLEKNNPVTNIELKEETIRDMIDTGFNTAKLNNISFGFAYQSPKNEDKSDEKAIIQLGNKFFILQRIIKANIETKSIDDKNVELTEEQQTKIDNKFELYEVIKVDELKNTKNIFNSIIGG
ncbi:MAG: hypothetical protein U0354_15625 [Candidatus Sericytochromatia bacterium]